MCPHMAGLLARYERSPYGRHGRHDGFLSFALAVSRAASLGHIGAGGALAAFVALDATFLAESALWTEEVSASGEKFEALGAVAGSPEAQMFAAAEEALAALEQTRPFGIEDYELAACEG